MRVQQSQAKHKLFVGGIPREMTKADLEDALNAVVKGGQGLETMPRVTAWQPWAERGWGLLSLHTTGSSIPCQVHMLASLRQLLLLPNLTLQLSMPPQHHPYAVPPCAS